MVSLHIYFRMSLADVDRMSDDWMLMIILMMMMMMMMMMEVMMVMVILDAHDDGDGNGYTCSQNRISQPH